MYLTHCACIVFPGTSLVRFPIFLLVPFEDAALYVCTTCRGSKCKQLWCPGPLLTLVCLPLALPALVLVRHVKQLEVVHL